MSQQLGRGETADVVSVCLVVTDTMHFLFSKHPNISKASRNKGHVTCPVQVEADGGMTRAGKSLLMFCLCGSSFSVFQRMDSGLVLTMAVTWWP